MRTMNELAAVENTLRSTARARLCHRLARALTTSFCISPDDDRLVLFLGNGTERNNLEAIQQWVDRALDRWEIDQAPVLLANLIDYLDQDLQTLEHNEWR